MGTFLEKMEEEKIEAIIRPLFAKEGGEELAMNEILVVALVREMRQNGRNGPSPESIEGLVHVPSHCRPTQAVLDASNSGRLPGKNWRVRLYRRHPDLKRRRAKALDLSDMTAISIFAL